MNGHKTARSEEQQNKARRASALFTFCILGSVCLATAVGYGQWLLGLLAGICFSCAIILSTPADGNI